MRSQSRRLVEVAVLTGMPKILTYHLPKVSQLGDLVGRRAVVPVGRQQLLGVILREEGDFKGTTKSIIDLPDIEPVLSLELLRLARFVSDYYFAPLGEVLRTIIPSALSGKIRQQLRITNREQLKTAAADGNAEAAALLELLGRRRKLSLSELQGSGLSVSMLQATGFGTLFWDTKRVGSEATAQSEESSFDQVPPTALANSEPKLELAQAQTKAIEAVSGALARGKFETFLLHGVTGSGKTEVYLEAVKRVISAGGQALLVVPEIGLSQALHSRLQSTFGSSLGLFHSRLSASERLSVWQKARSKQIKVVLGARSAVFTDLPGLGLIVVDEEHDQSLKQDSPAPRYHARDIAIMRGKLQEIPVVLGSATPSVESFYNARSGKYQLLELPERVASRPMPTVTIVDRRAQFQKGDYSFLSSELLAAISAALQKDEQIMVLLNRRGFAPSIRCYDCGETLSCRNCDVTLVYHKLANKVVCHTCGYQDRYPERCPSCQSNLFLYGGIGTERLEEELRSNFPDAGIVRMDFDSTRRRGSYDSIFRKFSSGEAQILLGTQMISKGLDFPQVSLVGVVSADTALDFPDFRARERTFQLLTQVAGRAGRGSLAGRVLMQTLNPEEAVIRFAACHDYAGFFQSEIADREALNFPPFCHLILLSVEATGLTLAADRSELLAKRLNVIKRAPFQVLGPVAAPLARRKQVHRYHILLKTERVKSTLGALQHLLQAKEFQHNRRLRVIVDVDAVDML